MKKILLNELYLDHIYNYHLDRTNPTIIPLENIIKFSQVNLPISAVESSRALHRTIDCTSVVLGTIGGAITIHVKETIAEINELIARADITLNINLGEL